MTSWSACPWFFCGGILGFHFDLVNVRFEVMDERMQGLWIDDDEGYVKGSADELLRDCGPITNRGLSDSVTRCQGGGAKGTLQK